MAAPPVSGSLSPRALALAALLLASAIYLPALRNGFAYDDAIIIQNHPLVIGHAWAALWASPYHVGKQHDAPTGIYRPLTIASYAVDHALFRGSPTGFHATSILWHGIVTALLVLMALRFGLGERGALVAGLLFAVHPVHAETVAALAGRSDLLTTALALAATLAALPAAGGRSRPALAGICLGAALLAKEAALPVAALLPALPWIGGPAQDGDPAARWRASRGLAVASCCAVAAYLAIRYAVLGGVTLPAGAVTFYENPLVGQSLPTRVRTVFVIFTRVVGLIVAPVRLSPDYGFAVIEPARSSFRVLVAAGAALLAGIATAAWFARRSARTVFLIVWCLATWAIVSNLFVIIGTPLAERQLYLPSVGACLLAALGFERAARRWGARIAVTVLALFALLGLVRTTTWTRAWANDETLFSAALESAPRSLRVLGNLAVERADAGRLDEARELLERAVDLAPEFLPNLVNLAGVQLDLKDVPAAKRTAERGVAVDPRSALAQAQLGVVQAAGGELEAAEASLREAVRLDPEFTDARKRLEDVVRRRAASGSGGP